ncbi:MAG: hypothetical protein HY898_31140 [Deltaproteobacteria bacterium]|nr:hypothetical protein [Deltaproteobacteria bacterium]
MKRVALFAMLAACGGSGAAAPMPAVEAQPVPLGSAVSPAPGSSADAAAVVDAAPPSSDASAAVRRAHADGPSGSVEIVICSTHRGKSLGLEIGPKQGTSRRATLGEASAMTPDESIRFVDVDHDGLPDPVIANLPGPGDPKPLVPAVVYLTGESRGSVLDCGDWLPPDRGSDGFMVGARTLDEAASALAAIPHQWVTDKQACAFVDARGSRSSRIYGYPGSNGMLEHRSTQPDAILSCRAKVPDGNGLLRPVMQCDKFRPYCEFGLASGGTMVPPYERRYWFDVTAGKLIVVGVPEH